MPGIFWVVPAAGIAAIIFAILMARDVLRRSPGTARMEEVGAMIFEGAWAFLKRQYSTIGWLAVVVAIVVGVLVGLLGGQRGIEGITAFGIAWRTGIAFIAGAFFSAVSGFIGMIIAVKTNARCAYAAHHSLKEAVTVALRGGAVPGFLVVALSLLGVTVIYLAYGGADSPNIAPHLIVGFGFGASFVALFAQLGGGIYTKAADMGADLVGKVEAGIPEDDPRNPAVIADLVGDNVGDCAGRGADLFESTAAENIGAMILGITIYALTGQVYWILFPLVVRAFGIIASMVGIMLVRIRGNENPMNALNRGYYAAVLLSIIGMFFTVRFMLDSYWLFAAGVVGIIASVVIVFITQYYTESRYGPVRGLVNASATGSATNIVSGMSLGFASTLPTALTIGVALLLAYWMGTNTGLPGAGAFGTAVATMGMLMTCPYILSEDTFGPIADNAQGINEMAAGDTLTPEARKISSRLDAVGNTTKALTKGYAMVSAGLAAFLLFQAYLDRVSFLRGRAFDDVNLARIEVFIGALLAVVLVFLFSSWAIRAVSGAASKIIMEVRRQFQERPRIMTGEERPDYARAVDITTRAALRGMVAPGMLPVLGPIVIGVFFNLFKAYDAAMTVAAVLMVGTIIGIMLAAFMNNGGGAWDNAKKHIEDGFLGGKGSEAHKAAVCGDTVGDPLKDTVGPSLHVVVKLLATVTLVMCPLFI
ncbi:MAG: sodium-translocating pyrophosphatase [Chloroflexi bacterium RBG_16_60_22]|nr:MAG: sodium-translocating pyrophosphatase [Chloroflexi bacterium RBG_16_60_22]